MTWIRMALPRVLPMAVYPRGCVTARHPHPSKPSKREGAAFPARPPGPFLRLRLVRPPTHSIRLHTSRRVTTDPRPAGLARHASPTTHHEVPSVAPETIPATDTMLPPAAAIAASGHGRRRRHAHRSRHRTDRHAAATAAATSAMAPAQTLGMAGTRLRPIRHRWVARITVAALAGLLLAGVGSAAAYPASAPTRRLLSRLRRGSELARSAAVDDPAQGADAQTKYGDHLLQETHDAAETYEETGQNADPNQGQSGDQNGPSKQGNRDNKQGGAETTYTSTNHAARYVEDTSHVPGCAAEQLLDVSCKDFWTPHVGISDVDLFQQALTPRELVTHTPTTLPVVALAKAAAYLAFFGHTPLKPPAEQFLHNLAMILLHHTYTEEDMAVMSEQNFFTMWERVYGVHKALLPTTGKLEPFWQAFGYNRELTPEAISRTVAFDKERFSKLMPKLVNASVGPMSTMGFCETLQNPMGWLLHNPPDVLDVLRGYLSPAAVMVTRPITCKLLPGSEFEHWLQRPKKTALYTHFLELADLVKWADRVVPYAEQPMRPALAKGKSGQDATGHDHDRDHDHDGDGDGEAHGGDAHDHHDGHGSDHRRLRLRRS
ncbi:hypothetical protein CXG81DRAFT_19640 [Caulochytrium protostelioides]|uniref:Uncharacterized protein n=1 Tax=Caulochytrium protostelioides TaxID=1555241 RepID=A0A4P9X5K9_9FUNG|nr:hypothetical protein CXG81DRAFT_19640 [Caulochytrium protostelioides]|eukprot:RKP00392.1 hypothetical protein CXG81DRAFT_19640 [Caulochytrium protostelioides]